MNPSWTCKEIFSLKLKKKNQHFSRTRSWRGRSKFECRIWIFPLRKTCSPRLQGWPDFGGPEFENFVNNSFTVKQVPGKAPEYFNFWPDQLHALEHCRTCAVWLWGGQTPWECSRRSPHSDVVQRWSPETSLFVDFQEMCPTLGIAIPWTRFSFSFESTSASVLWIWKRKYFYHCKIRLSIIYSGAQSCSLTNESHVFLPPKCVYREGDIPKTFKIMNCNWWTQLWNFIKSRFEEWRLKFMSIWSNC